VRPSGVIVCAVSGVRRSLVEFSAEDPERVCRFWTELLGVELEAREAAEGAGWQTHSEVPAVGDVAEALERVEALGGSVVHPGEAWAICKDSEEAHSDWRSRRSAG
jgi:predicted enzyme related to lactoylglutathione lyase